MTDRHQEAVDRDLQVALRRLAADTGVPPPDPAREAALLAAFDTRRLPSRRAARGYWWTGAVAAAAIALIVLGVLPARDARRALLPSKPVAVGEFVPWPGARDLPPLESGELMRVDLPVSMLPSLGMAPPASHVTAVKADVIVGQDGLARAVRLVAN